MKEKESTKISLGLACVIIVIIVFLAVLITCGVVFKLQNISKENNPVFIGKKDEKKVSDNKYNEGLNVVPTMQDKIEEGKDIPYFAGRIEDTSKFQ